MRIYIYLLFFVFIGACRPSPKNYPPVEPLTGVADITNKLSQRINTAVLSGTYSDTTLYSPAPAYHHTITDTVFTVTMVGDSLLIMKGMHDPVKYFETDSALQFIRYKKDWAPNGIIITFTWYYAIDSLTYDYYQYIPTENPHENNMNLSTHR